MGRLSGLENRYENLLLRDQKPWLSLSERTSRTPIDSSKPWGKQLVAAYPNATHFQHGEKGDEPCDRTGCKRKLGGARGSGARSQTIYADDVRIAKFCSNSCMHAEISERLAQRVKRKR